VDKTVKKRDKIIIIKNYTGKKSEEKKKNISEIYSIDSKNIKTPKDPIDDIYLDDVNFDLFFNWKLV
jgi:hypothetical protein